MIQNAGSRFQRTFADEPLLERLRLLPRDETVDARVREKCISLFAEWSRAYKSTPGLERIANLAKEVPKTSRPQASAARQKVLRETDPFQSEQDVTPEPASRSRNTSIVGASAPTTYTSSHSSFSSMLSKSKKPKQTKAFSLSNEKQSMTDAIAQSSIASTNLLNSLQLINREAERVSENQEVLRRFDACKSLRRKILYYIQHVESDQWIGSLVNANDELIKALTAYEILDKSVDDDSDSDGFENSDHLLSKADAGPSAETQRQLAGLNIAETAPAKPPRPTSIAMPPKPAPMPVASGAREDEEGEDEEEDDPFGDSNAAPTPYQERSGMTWRDV